MLTNVSVRLKLTYEQVHAKIRKANISYSFYTQDHFYISIF